MAKAPKPANQGSPAKGAPTQKPMTSGRPGRGEAPTTAQDKRGYHTPGTRGSGKGAR